MVSRSYKAVIPSGSVKGIFIIVTAELRSHSGS